MREILFRGKTDKGKWEQGDLLVKGLDFETAIRKLYEENNILYGSIIKVIPETIGKYTGLTDKNDKRIFEGDIVSISGELKGIYACVWEENNFEYEFNNKAISFSLACVHSDDIEVIGNIHDNPELISN